jgi:hypothetical protein
LIRLRKQPQQQRSNLPTGARLVKAVAVKKWRRVILIGIPVLLIFGFPTCEHFRGKILLSRYKAKLRKQGEKLTVAELFPTPIVGENHAKDLMAAINGLRAGKILDQHYPSNMRLVGPGIAAVGHARTNWLDDKETYTWEQLRPELETNADALTNIRVLIKNTLFLPVDHLVLLDNPILPHLLLAKRLAIILSIDALSALHDGNIQRAFEDIAAEIQLQKLFEREPFLISQLVRIAIRAIAFNSTWEALQHDGWTDEQLGEIQRLWEEGDFFGGMEQALQTERVWGAAQIERTRESHIEAVKMLSGGGWGSSSNGDFLEEAKSKALNLTINYARIPFWRFAWSHQDEKHYLELLQALLDFTRAGITAKSYERAQPLRDKFEAAVENENLYDGSRYLMSPLFASSLSKCSLKATQAETFRSLAITAIALKRYQLKHGVCPETLNDLVPEFLASAPVDYWDGKPVRYEKQGNRSFLLYSVGEDCVDNGGDGSPRSDGTSFALHNAKDVVWPKPATYEQIKSFESKH